MSKKVLDYITLPVVDDGMGIYIFDSNTKQSKDSSTVYRRTLV